MDRDQVKLDLKRMADFYERNKPDIDRFAISPAQRKIITASPVACGCRFAGDKLYYRRFELV